MSINNIIEFGVVMGRFQPFHVDHLAYLRAAKSGCRRLVVGITNPDPLRTASDSADPSRTAPDANPLSYYERLVVIRETLRGDGWDCPDFDVIPLPINSPELIPEYVPSGATFYLTVYDAWGRKKAEAVRALGYLVEILWDRPLEAKGLSASTIRRAIREGRPWEHFLHPAGAAALRRFGMVDKIRRDTAAG